MMPIGFNRIDCKKFPSKIANTARVEPHEGHGIPVTCLIIQT